MSDSPPSHIRPRERDAILQSLRAGVVPRAGQQHIQVGRIRELNTMVDDVAKIAEGGSTIRFIIGEYGSGKTFFLMLVRAIALQERLVTVHADLSPDRRLQGSNGQARSLFAELMVNMSTRAKPDGGALHSVIERFVSSAIEEAASVGSTPDKVIATRLGSLREMVGGFDFATVIAAYWEGSENGNDELQANAVRWLRGEILTKTDARAALGVRTIVDDANWYDHLKLMSRFVRMAGYQGLLICVDELVNLYKLANTTSRSANYEQLLRILNDSLQGTAAGMGWLLGGTPEFLLDTRRGLYSYQALQSRLEENTFAGVAWSTTPARSCVWPTCHPKTSMFSWSNCAMSTPAVIPRSIFCPTVLSAPSWSIAQSASAMPTSVPLATPSRSSSTFWLCSSRTLAHRGPRFSEASRSRRNSTQTSLRCPIPNLATLRRSKLRFLQVQLGNPRMMMDSVPSSSEPSAFSQLHPGIQRWIWDQKWGELRPAQAQAVAPILGGQRDVIISAATASGKTEAAFLPMLSAVAAKPATSPGIEILYLSPLKALINDQFDRLSDLAGAVDVSVHRWHGDVAGNKKTEVLRKPTGLLLITPESLEALFVLRGLASVHSLRSPALCRRR